MRFRFRPKFSQTKHGTILMYLGPQLVNILYMRRARLGVEVGSTS